MSSCGRYAQLVGDTYRDAVAAGTAGALWTSPAARATTGATEK